jgi:hypothetical protein
VNQLTSAQAISQAKAQKQPKQSKSVFGFQIHPNYKTRKLEPPSRGKYDFAAVLAGQFYSPNIFFTSKRQQACMRIFTTDRVRENRFLGHFPY